MSGPIVVVVSCVYDNYCDEETPPIRVTAAGKEVAGTTEIVRGEKRLYVAFRPEVPLMDGGRYDVEVFGIPEYSEPYKLSARAKAVTAEVVEAADVVLDACAYPTGQEYCCGGGFACSPTCVTDEARIEAVLGFPWPEHVVALYRMRWAEADGSTHETPWGPDASARFAQPAATYCATLEIKNLLDGEVSAHEVCREGDEGLRVGAHVPTEIEPYRFTLDCRQPPSAPGIETPPRLVQAWCDAWRAACEQNRDACPPVEVGERCGFEVPAVPSDDAGARADADVAPTPADSDRPARHRTTSSCATRAAGTQAGWSALLVLLSLALGLRCRRRG